MGLAPRRDTLNMPNRPTASSHAVAGSGTAAASAAVANGRVWFPIDATTVKFYEKDAAEIASRYETIASPVMRYIGATFVAGSRILNVGAGTGRDAAFLSAQGFDAYGVEPSLVLRQARSQCISRTGQSGRVLSCGRFGLRSRMTCRGSIGR